MRHSRAAARSQGSGEEQRVVEMSAYRLDLVRLGGRGFAWSGRCREGMLGGPWKIRLTECTLVHSSKRKRRKSLRQEFLHEVK